MAETKEAVQNPDGKDYQKGSVAPEAVTSEKTKVAAPDEDAHQFGEEQEFTDTITGTVVKAFSLAEAVDKINEQNKKENK